MFQPVRRDIFLIFNILCLVSMAVHAAGETEVVPVYEEPYHRLVFERKDVRVFNTSIPAGDASRYHRHENPTQYVVLGFSKMRNQDLGSDWVTPEGGGVPPVGALLFRNYGEQPQEHRVDNIGDSSFQVMGVINYTQGGEGTGELAGGAENSNRWFDVYRHRLGKGKSSGGHRHANPVIVIQVSDGRSHVVVDGRPGSVKTVKGNWSWHEAGVGHRIKNSGDTMVELVEIEIKQPSMGEE